MASKISPLYDILLVLLFLYLRTHALPLNASTLQT
jgi:hypothetical protein